MYRTEPGNTFAWITLTTHSNFFKILQLVVQGSSDFSKTHHMLYFLNSWGSMISNMTYEYIFHTYWAHLAHILRTTCTHLTHILHTSYTHLTHILHTSCTCLEHILHTYWAHLAQFLHTSYTHLAHILHTSCPHLAHTLHILKIHKYKVLKRQNMCYIFKKHGIQGFQIWHSLVSNVKYTNMHIHFHITFTYYTYAWLLVFFCIYTH